MRTHTPVLLDALIRTVGPVEGTWIDCTLGAGGCSQALLDAGAKRVFGVDCDPHAIQTAAKRGLDNRSEFTPILARFGEIEQVSVIAAAAPVDGMVFDLGVSSMQLDTPSRGFSFTRDGPLDMRMSGRGKSAADIVNGASQEDIASILRNLGEERKAGRIARAICNRRRLAPIQTTAQLAEIVAGCLPRTGEKTHPATRCFQALRIAVNDELGQLVHGLNSAERLLKAGGRLAVISFHSIEDRIVKRFIQGGISSGGSRHLPARDMAPPRFRPRGGGWQGPAADEISRNPRSRSARLRAAERTLAPPFELDSAVLGVPGMAILG